MDESASTTSGLPVQDVGQPTGNLPASPSGHGPALSQARISAELGVTAAFDPAAELDGRVGFLVQMLEDTGARGYVLAISGGVDSATAGRLCQLAIERVRGRGGAAVFLAMRLPFAIQVDEVDAQRALAFVAPDLCLTVDVAPATAALAQTISTASAVGIELERVAEADVVLGNIKARQRMTAQYAVANAHGLLVVGTDHASEAVTGFFTKHGDGACDVMPLAGLTKRRVRALASALGADAEIVNKTPTADLEDSRPGVPDETVLGLTYDEIDDFLEGRAIPEETHAKIVARYLQTAHKRAAAPRPPLPNGS